METIPSYVAAWTQYRKLKISALIFLLGFPPFLGGVAILFERTRWNEYVGLALDVVYLLVMMVVGARYALWPCPRCGQSYRGFRSITGNYCYFCKLPKWAEADFSTQMRPMKQL